MSNSRPQSPEDQNEARQLDNKGLLLGENMVRVFQLDTYYLALILQCSFSREICEHNN